MENVVDKKVKVLSLWYSADKLKALKQYGELKVNKVTKQDVFGVRGILLYENYIPQFIAIVKEVILGELEDEYILRIDSLHPWSNRIIAADLSECELKPGQGYSHKVSTVELDKIISECETLPFNSALLARDFLTLASATEMLANTYGVLAEQVNISISNKKVSAEKPKV